MEVQSKLFIGGEFIVSSDNSSFSTINPATEEKICEVSLANEEDVNNCVLSSKKAQVEWFSLDASQRGKALLDIAKAIENAGDELANLDCLDGGRPILDCKEDVHAAVEMFNYFGGIVDKIKGNTIPVQNDKLCYTRREPYGVVAAITAWNYPLFNACAKIAPIIATGNSCILKPAEETPLTALKLAEIIQSIRTIPQGLVSVINGPGEITGEALTRHDGVSKISFTGSTETGRKILRASADTNLKGAVLELGGKSPFIIFDDANIEMALNGIVFSVFYNQGQTCTAGTRLLVQEGSLEKVLNGLDERIEKLTIGDPISEETVLGAIISKEQHQKIINYVDDAVESGISLYCGGKIPSNIKKGFFYEPTVFLNVPSESKICKEEIFGPVLVVQTFSDEEEVIKMANDSKYGLASSIWTKSSQRLTLMANRIETGIVWCNTVFAEHPGAPAGGYKQSGYGREYGDSAVDEYMQLKTVWVDLSDDFFSWP